LVITDSFRTFRNTFNCAVAFPKPLFQEFFEGCHNNSVKRNFIQKYHRRKKFIDYSWNWSYGLKDRGEGRNVYRVLMGKPEGKRPLERQRRRWVDGIKMDLREIGWGGVELIHLAQDRDRWRAVVNAVMNLRVLAPRS
jgi:hypothetical protein